MKNLRLGAYADCDQDKIKAMITILNGMDLTRALDHLSLVETKITDLSVVSLDNFELKSLQMLETSEQ